MTNDSFRDIDNLESDLWEAADNVPANSKLRSSDYLMPVLGVIFRRHSTNRFEAAHLQIEADRASGNMPAQSPPGRTASRDARSMKWLGCTRFAKPVTYYQDDHKSGRAEADETWSLRLREGQS